MKEAIPGGNKRQTPVNHMAAPGGDSERKNAFLS